MIWTCLNLMLCVPLSSWSWRLPQGIPWYSNYLIIFLGRLMVKHRQLDCDFWRTDDTPFSFSPFKSFFVPRLAMCQERIQMVPGGSPPIEKRTLRALLTFFNYEWRRGRRKKKDEEKERRKDEERKKWALQINILDPSLLCVVFSRSMWCTFTCMYHIFK